MLAGRPAWRNGRRSGLKIRFLRECRFESGSGHQAVGRLYFKRRLVWITTAPNPANGLGHRHTHKPQGLPGTGRMAGSARLRQSRTVRSAMRFTSTRYREYSVMNRSSRSAAVVVLRAPLHRPHGSAPSRILARSRPARLRTSINEISPTAASFAVRLGATPPTRAAGQSEGLHARRIVSDPDALDLPVPKDES